MKLNKHRYDMDRGAPIVAEQLTVERYLIDWLTRIDANLRPRSFERYREAVQLHLTPTLGRVRLARLSMQQVEALYAAKLKEGLAPSTVLRLHAVLHKALADAERLGFVARNVASHARAPRVERKEMRYFTPLQAQQLLAALESDRLEAFYTLAITTGMRRGELLALRWSDVNLTKGYLEVKHTLQFGKVGAFTFAPPKTAKGLRRVPLNQMAVLALQRQKERQDVERTCAANLWQEYDLVFATNTGNPLRGNHILQRHFEPLCQRLGLPRIRLHDLRHTAATLWLHQGVPTEVVSSILGHSAPSITSDIYMHVTTEMQRNAAETLDRLLTRDTEDA